ncbi:MAG: diaminopimelate epimerase [Brumimicrobium sp.]
MNLSFKKYHGTGNDFIMLDCTENPDFKLTNSQISELCDRRFGIGADGLIMIFKHPTHHFRMRYHNPDGSQSFCGNGARCAVHFARQLRLFDNKAIFVAVDGLHEATFEGELISLKMNDVQSINFDKDAYVIDTGSPHYIKFTDKLASQDIVKIGREIRYSQTYKANGINVNLVEIKDDNSVEMLTYERGVEDETYSCGTGATAVALAFSDKSKKDNFEIKIKVKGGNLKVKGKRNPKGFTDIYLIGPAINVFSGTIQLL